MTEQPYRVDRRMVLGDWPAFVILVCDLAFGLWALPRLPNQIPVHWGLSGQPDRMGPAWEAALLSPLLACGIYLMMLYAPLLDPRRNNYRLFSGFYGSLRKIIPLVLVVIHIGVVANGLGYPLSPVTLIRVTLPLLFLMIGNHIGQVRPNYFVGIRTPWTLANEEVWTRTHRLSGRIWVAGSLIMLATAALPAAWGFAIFMSAVGIMVIVPVIYSYLLFVRTKG